MFVFQLDYRFVLWRTGDEWTQEHRPHVNGTVLLDFMGVSLRDRNRIEYQILEGRPNVLRYRNMLTISPSRRLFLRTRPYLADEFYYNVDARDVTRNRLYVGTGITASTQLRLLGFYLLQSDRRKTGWERIHILGMKVNVTL